jgi:two-component system cell cycle response regulator DivK
MREAPLVLVVDDYRDARELYVETLLVAGFRVAEAADGHEAVMQARALLPQVVLMDLSLPGKDGWQATRELKDDPATRHIPVIALTGHSHAAAQAAAAAAGCDAFITKPCLPDAVVAEVRARLGPPR